MKFKPGEASYTLQKDGTIKWNIKNRDLPELARFFYLQLLGIDGTLNMLRKEIARLNEIISKLKSRRNK